MENGLITYIKSGEFTFCSRCGDIARYGDTNFMCIKCIEDLFPKGKATSFEREEKGLARSAEEAISDIINEHRSRLAILRRQYSKQDEQNTN